MGWLELSFKIAIVEAMNLPYNFTIHYGTDI